MPQMTVPERVQSYFLSAVFFRKLQDIGFLQGLYELNMDEDMSDALTENIDTLMIIPSKVFCPEARYFFIEKGAIKFKEDIENLLSAYKNRDIFQIALGTLSEAILKNEDIR